MVILHTVFNIYKSAKCGFENGQNFNKLKFNFEYKNRLIRTNFDDNEYFKFDTPFLKVHTREIYIFYHTNEIATIVT